MSAVNRFFNQWRRNALDRDFEDELRFHLEQRIGANVRAGMSHTDAEAEARRHLGSTLRATEGMREARISGFIDSLVRDVRHGWRVFRRQPGLTALALVTLSLGIGANAAMFSLIDAVLLRPLPFPDAGRLVAVVDGFRTTGSQLTSPTIPELLDARASIRNLRSLSFFDTRDFQIDGGSEPMRVLGARVEPSLLPLLGARPALGRLIEAADSEADGTRIVVLSDGLWRRNFGSDPAVVGRQVIVNGQPFRIAGVTAPDFGFDVLVGQQAEMFVPYPLVPIYTSRQAEFANVRRVVAIGRLAEGVAIESASAELAAFSRTLASQYPALYHREADGRALGFFMDAEPLRDRVMGGGEHTLLMLLAGAVGLVLLIACVNTVQFLLAQSIERQSEVAVRSALGAARARLLRQFLSEALLLAAAAGSLGLLQAVWLTRLLRGVLPEGVLVGRTIGVDATMLLFTAGVALAVALACGLFPALRLSRRSPGRGIETRGAPGRRARARQLFIAVEVAISVVLLISAGLLLRSIEALQQSPRGYDARDVSVLRLRGFGAGRLGPTYQRYLEEVARVPGVEAAAITSGVLPGSPENPFTIVGLPSQTADDAAVWGQNASYQMVSGSYFSVLRIPLRQGRTFASDDGRGRLPVAIVNEALARRYFPGRSPLGQQIRSGPGPRAATMTIVGVVGNVRPMFQQADEPQIYVSVLQQDEPSVALIVRAGENRPLSVKAVKQAVWSVVPQQAVFGVVAMADLVAGSMADHRAVATLLGSFALLALVMSVTGIYTVVTYLMSRRTKEIALRRAIGARGVDMFALLAGPAVRWTLAGVLAGALGAVAAGRVLRAALAGIVPLDALTVVLISALYLVVVAVAMSVPAIKALRVDPATALRAE
jgi:predicted permease